MPQWNPKTEFTVIDVRVCGPGNDWEILEYDAELAAPSGGGVPIDSRWGRGRDGQPEYRGQVQTGNPERFTAQVMTRLVSERFLTELTKLKKAFDLRVRQKCDDPNDMTNYTELIEYFDGGVTSRGYSGQLANASTNQDEDIKNQYDASFGLEVRMVKVRHDNLSGSVSDVAINDVRVVSNIRCDGYCVPETVTAIAVTDQDSTPGYQAIPAPIFLYTLDGGVNWETVYIDVFPTADATCVLKVGDRILVSSPTRGVAYARWQDILDEVANPWTLSTGFTAPNGVNAMSAVGTRVMAVGNAGRVWLSTDGGLSFSAVAAANVVTTENLNCVVMASDNLAWIGGQSGVLLRYNQSVLSVVPVRHTDGTLLSANILTVDVAAKRGRQPFLGTSTGYVWTTLDGLASRPVFTTPEFDQRGTGQIRALRFAGLWGDVLFMVQTGVAGDSRVIRDLSGGKFGASAEIVGSFIDPANNGINAIALADVNTGITVGEVAGTAGFIGRLTGVVRE